MSRYDKRWRFGFSLVILWVGCSREPPTLITPDRPFEAQADAPSWPRFGGHAQGNLSTDGALRRRWPESGPPLDWTATGIGHGFAGITTAGGLIYTAGNMDGYAIVSALYLDDGTIRWQAVGGPGWTGDYEGTRGTPTIDAGRVYYESPLGDVVCLDAATGERIWQRNVLTDFGAKNIKWALAESLLVDGDRVICCPGGRDASVAALDKMTGTTIWVAEGTGEAAGYASPTLAEHQGLRMILTMSAKALIGVDADTGTRLFRHDHPTRFDVNALKPIYRDGHVFISSGYGAGSTLLRINVTGRRATLQTVWKSNQLDNQHGGVLLVDGYLYGAADRSNNGKWVCLDWNTGHLQYAERGVGKGAVAYADGMLYTLSERRKVGLVEATPSGHPVISQFRIPSGGEGPTWAHPVVVGGRLYIRHSDRLFAYDVRATSPSASP